MIQSQHGPPRNKETVEHVTVKACAIKVEAGANFNFSYYTIFSTQWSLTVRSAIFFPANHLTGAKSRFRPNLIAIKLQHKSTIQKTNNN